MKRLLPVLAASLALVFAACGGGGGDEDQDRTPAPVLGGAIVTYDTSDGVSVVAEFAVPEGVEDPPVVILLHQRDGSRAQWAPLVPKLLEQGYAVLAPDLRSFGDSTRCTAGGRQARCQLKNLDELLQDFGSALTWLRAQRGVDTDRIAVIGASIGGNLAYVAAGAFPLVDTAVAISPNAKPSGGALLGANIPNFNPDSVLFMSDENEDADAQALAKNVAKPVEVKVYEGQTAHGVELLENPEAVQDILDWLEETL